jgi:hypothetical protein
MQGDWCIQVSQYMETIARHLCRSHAALLELSETKKLTTKKDRLFHVFSNAVSFFKRRFHFSPVPLRGSGRA